MVGSSFIFVAFGVFLVVFVSLGVFILRSWVKGVAAQREELQSASAEELESFRATYRERSSNGFLKIGAPIFTFIGGVLLAVGIFTIGRANDSESWPVVEGKVVQTDVIRKSAEDHAGWTYRAKVEYQYTVEGTTYEGDRVSFAGRVSTNNEADALEVIATYREGSKVAVYYDPADPEEAVLEPGLTGMVFLFPVIGGVFLVIGLGLLFALLMGKRKDLEPEPFE